MKAITKYQARDGREFSDRIECEKHELFLGEIDKIESMLAKRPDDTKFANGGGYVYQNRETITKARSLFLDLAGRVLRRDVRQVSGSWLGRYLDDNDSPLYSFYLRLFYCIDQHSREWGQVYYANHPDRGTQSEYKEEQAA